MKAPTLLLDAGSASKPENEYPRTNPSYVMGLIELISGTRYRKVKKSRVNQFNSIVYRSLWRKSSRFRECIFNLALMCEENTITDAIKSVEDFNQLVSNLTPTVYKFMQQFFDSNKFLDDIKQIVMYDDEMLHTCANKRSTTKE